MRYAEHRERTSFSQAEILAIALGVMARKGER
jgi:hypothetical protein